MKKSKKQNWSETLKTFQSASGLGFAIIIPIVLGAFFGVFLDKFLRTKPILTIILIFLGIFTGIGASIKITKEIIQK